MPRSTQEIIDQADALARRFEDRVPTMSNAKSADSLMGVRQAFLSRADAEQVLMDAVHIARVDRVGAENVVPVP